MSSNPPIYPQLQVVPFTMTGANASTGYFIEMIPGLVVGQAPDMTPQVLDATNAAFGTYASYAEMIQALGLAAKINYAASPYAYVVGTGANNFTTDALCKAAAEADCQLIVTQRNTVLATTGGIGTSNPFVTIGAPVLGPL
jgi:hypothetical protein